MGKIIEFEWLKRLDGTSEFQEFLDSLPDKDQTKLLATVRKIEEFGLQVAAREEWIDHLDEEVYEIRSKFASNIQRALYFHVEKKQYKITHGFTKKTQKTPPKQIQHAKDLIKKYRNGDLK